jgi:Xaa-Pro dipeptidase
MSKQQSLNIYKHRQDRLIEEINARELDAFVLNPGPSLTYLTGMRYHIMERPIIVIITPELPLTLVIPELESAKTLDIPYPIQIFMYTDDPSTWSKAFSQAAIASGIQGDCRIGVEPNHLRVLELNYIENAAPQAIFISAESTLSALRAIKGPKEIESIRKATEIAQKALELTLPMIKIGMTEKQIAAELTLQLLRNGSESELPFSPIVSAGPNSANPHASPTERLLQDGDLLVIDWGARYQGYVSDITRTFAVGEVDPKYKRIVDVVAEANAVARQVVRPGIPASEIDKATRNIIQQAGYGEFFTHRTGHGLGMEGHEEPYIHSANDSIIIPGMTFTIEPGIYLPARNGSRIEDDILITKDGSVSLTDLPRNLRLVG